MDQWDSSYTYKPRSSHDHDTSSVVKYPDNGFVQSSTRVENCLCSSTTDRTGHPKSHYRALSLILAALDDEEANGSMTLYIDKSFTFSILVTSFEYVEQGTYKDQSYSTSSHLC